MNLEKNQAIKNQIEKEFITYIKTLRVDSNYHNPYLHNHNQILQIYLNSPNESKEQISNIFELFDFSSKIPKTKSRLCGGILKRGDRAYKCHECLNEDNSILCMKCFDLEKHKGHQFELIQVYGGCCDCGDPQKWSKDGFCKEHSSNEISEIQINKQILQDFLSTHIYSLCIMVYFYQTFIQRYNWIKDQDYSQLNFNQKDKQTLLDGFKRKTVPYLERYGTIFINQLIEFNKNGQYANKFTYEFLKLAINNKQFTFFQQIKDTKIFESKNILSILFSFIQFNKLPSAICDLFITLFQLIGFREVLTIEYIQNYHKYSDFVISDYTSLSSQLFTSYITISQIVQQKKIAPLVMNILIAKQEDVQMASRCYVRFYYDIGYLSKLYGDASIDYFRFYAASHAMTSLCGYRNVFNPYPSSIDYYGIDQIFITRMFQLIKVIQRDQSKFIFKITLRDLYKDIISSQIRSDNYYRPQQRFFALLTFAYFEGDLSQLENEDNMVEFLATISSDNLEYELKIIIKRLCTILSFAASLLENQKRTSDYYTFYSFYFKKTSNLFNLDSILFKIVIKMCEFYNSHTSETINLAKMIQNGDLFFDMYNKMIKYSANKSTLDTQVSIGQPLDVLRPQHFKHFIFYLSLINEAIASDLPILAMRCALQPKPEEVKKLNIPKLIYIEQADFYYRNILMSCENSRVSIKDFKMICDSFFIEEEIFKSFVIAHQDDSDKRRLNAQKCKGFKLSPIFYKSIHLKIMGIDHRGDMGIIPYFQKRFSTNILSQSYESIWKSAQAYIIQSQIAHQKEMQGSSKSIISNLFNMIFTFLWTIYVQKKDIGVVNLLRVQIKKYKLQQTLPYLFKEIERQISQSPMEIQQQSQGNLSKQLKKKQKLLNKKQLMNQRMLKNKNAYIPSQSKVAEESHYLCCICKQQKQNQNICYIGFSTITNYHGWLDLHPENSFFSFSACGHMVHRSCKQVSQKGGKVYNYCPLCKKPTNIIIPQKDRKISLQQAKIFMDELFDIIKIFGTQDSVQNLLYNSITGFLVFKGILFPQYFVKEVNIYSAIVTLFKIYYRTQDMSLLRKKISIQGLTFKTSSNTLQSKDIFDQFSNSLLKYFDDQQLEMRTSSSSAVSQIVFYLIKKLVQSKINTETLIDVQFPLKEKLQKNINHKQLPQKLGDFSVKYLGKCPNCGLATNLQAICLICPSFITCVKCEKMGLNFHSEKEHKRTCSFLKTNSGEIIYIYKNRHWIFESVYEDYMGRHYAGQTNKQDFELNIKKLNPYLEDIITCNIESKLRYKEKESNKVHSDATM